MLIIPGSLGTIIDAASGECWNAARLESGIDRRAKRLAAFGVGPNARVLIRHGGTPAFFADLFLFNFLLILCLSFFIASNSVTVAI